MLILRIEDGVATPMTMKKAIRMSIEKMDIGNSFKIEDTDYAKIAISSVAKELGVRVKTMIDADDKSSRRVWLVSRTRD